MQKNTIAYTCYLLCLFIIIFSCNGQKKIQPHHSPSSILSSADTLGNIVTELGNPSVVFQDSQNNYWFGGKGQGVIKYNGTGLICYTKEDGLCSNDILRVQEDQYGNIYFDTFEGVSKFDGQQFTTLEVIEPESSKHEWELTAGDLWFSMGWLENGPYRYDGQSLFHLEFPKPEQADTFYTQYPNASFNPYGIYSLYQDSKGAIWFGTSSLGVCRYDGQSVSWLYEEQLTTTPNGGAFGIRSILEDQQGYFWFNNTRYRYNILAGSSARNGVNYLNYNKEDGFEYTIGGGEFGYFKGNDESSFPYFNSMIRGNDGVLWMSNDELYKKERNKLAPHPIEGIETSILPSSLYQDNQGILWLLTPNFGVFRHSGNDFEKFEP